MTVFKPRKFTFNQRFFFAKFLVIQCTSKFLSLLTTLKQVLIENKSNCMVALLWQEA